MITLNEKLFDKKFIDIVEKSFPENGRNRKVKPCRIKFNGKFITTTSGKTVWKARGHAKCAFLNHLIDLFSYGLLKDYLKDFKSCSIFAKEAFQALEMMGTLEFIESEEVNFE